MYYTHYPASQLNALITVQEYSDLRGRGYDELLDGTVQTEVYITAPCVNDLPRAVRTYVCSSWVVHGTMFQRAKLSTIFSANSECTCVCYYSTYVQRMFISICEVVFEKYVITFYLMQFCFLLRMA